MPTLEQAREYMLKHVSNEYQRHHAEMVSLAMQAVAKHLSLDEAEIERWGVTGMIHDWDYDQWPETHPGQYEKLQSELGVDDETIDAIKGHGDIDFVRTTKMTQALLALDELSGLYYAYMKMVGNYKDMKVSSLNKKLTKELNFAAKIDRSYILKGIAELGIPQDELLEVLRDAFSAEYDSK